MHFIQGYRPSTDARRLQIDPERLRQISFDEEQVDMLHTLRNLQHYFWPIRSIKLIALD